ncbi:MAG: HTH domain-containing protein [Myxococcaceae bacterium]
MSERTQKILDYLRSQEKSELCIRQQTLAEHFNCSRRTIGRALKELKEAGLLTDLNKRDANRCKIYEIKIPLNPRLQRGELTQEAQLQWRLYKKTFGIVFRMFDGQHGRPLLEDCFKEVACKLSNVKNEEELYSKIFAGLRALPNLKETDMSWRSEPENRNAGGTYY